MITAYMNWSGGKDSAICLYKILQSKQYQVKSLLTSINSAYNRISIHGVRRSLLIAQAEAIGIPLQTIELPEQTDMEEYEKKMFHTVSALKHAGCTHSIFGDIFLEDLRIYREKKLCEIDISCVFPLWNRNTTDLANEFIDLGFKSIVVCVNGKYLDKSFCGRIIDHSFLEDLPANVDPCGERGEFHSFVYEAPIFKENILFTKGEVIYKEYRAPKNDKTGHTKADATPYGFYFCDLVAGNLASVNSNSDS